MPLTISRQIFANEIHTIAQNTKELLVLYQLHHLQQQMNCEILAFMLVLCIFRPPTKLGKGIVFTGVCRSF